MRGMASDEDGHSGPSWPVAIILMLLAASATFAACAWFGM